MSRPDSARLALAATIVLTFVTGVVDAVGFLGLDRVFTGNMTGNIVILGMGIAGADELPVLGPAVALAAFTPVRSPPEWSCASGAGCRTRVARPDHDLLTSGAVLGRLDRRSRVVATVPARAQVRMAAATAAVMGQQAVVARTVAVKDMTTVVVTSTLASLAGETWVRGGRGAVVNRRVRRDRCRSSSARLSGALLLRIHMAIPFALATACTFVVVILGHVILHERARHHSNLVGTESNRSSTGEVLRRAVRGLLR